MKNLHLLIPDLFPPQDIAAEACAGLKLPALEKLLARGAASTTAIDTLEERLCQAFAAEGVAPVRAAADGMDVGRGYWLCTDPVNLQLHRAQMVLQPDVCSSVEEAIALCAILNEHFAEQGLSFHAPHAQRWYVRVDEAPQVTMYPLSRVAWRDVRPFQPQGSDALRWQGVMTEVQMLLHAHPLNQVREERNELTINSLWLWGGGRDAQLQRGFDLVGGDSGLPGAFAQMAGVARSTTLQALLESPSENGLWICAAAGEASQRGDVYAWREAVQRVEHECAEPLLKALQTGRLQHLAVEVLQAGNARRFELTRGDAWKLWHAGRPLAWYAV